MSSDLLTCVQSICFTLNYKQNIVNGINILKYLMARENYGECDEYDETTAAELTDVDDMPDTRRRPHIKRPCEDFVSWSASWFNSVEVTQCLEMSIISDKITVSVFWCH